VDTAAFKAMSAADQEKTCCNEQADVANMLRADSVTFKNILAERITAMKAQQ
jgi:hypothetical protein